MAHLHTLVRAIPLLMAIAILPACDRDESIGGDPSVDGVNPRSVTEPDLSILNDPRGRGATGRSGPSAAPAQPATASAPVLAPETAPATSPASEAAAEEIQKYIEEHIAELRPKIEENQLNRYSAADFNSQVEKLKTILPPALSSKVDVAKPSLLVMMGRARDSIIALNLRRLGGIYSARLDKAQAEPNTTKAPVKLGELVPFLDPGDTLEMFVFPGTPIPPNIAGGDAAAKEAWVNEHTIYVLLPHAGAASAQAIVAHEKLDHIPGKQNIALLFSDIHVENVDRAKAEQLINAK